MYAQCSPELCYDPTTALDFQVNALPQLLFMSQPEGGDLLNGVASDGTSVAGQYLFDDSEGNHVPVYILDTGATIGHPEFTDPANSIGTRAQWLFVDDDSDVANAGRPKDDSGIKRGGFSNGGKPHGTSMLSLISGAFLGVAKQIDPILLRVPRRLVNGGGARNEDWLRGVSTILDDVNTRFPDEDPDKQFDARMVLLMSLYWPDFTVLTNDNPTRAEAGGFAARLYALLVQLSKRGVIIVCGSGNLGTVST